MGRPSSTAEATSARERSAREKQFKGSSYLGVIDRWWGARYQVEPLTTTTVVGIPEESRERT